MSAKHVRLPEGDDAADGRNPYLVSEGAYESQGFEHVSSGYVPVSTGGGHRRRGRLGIFGRALILLGVLAAIAAAVIFFVRFRPVSYTVNGSRRSGTINSTAEQIVEDEHLSYTPGNLVSVAGELLVDGGGTPFTLTLNGEKLSAEAMAAYGVRDGDVLEFSDGEDVMEEYDATTVEIQPKLVVEGSWGSIGYVAQWGRVGIEETRTGKVSGVTVESAVVKEVQDCIVRNVVPEPSDGRLLVALTFDDGPSQYTQRYLDILNEYGIHATFFNLGENVRNYPDLAKAITDQGSQLLSHTTNHLQLPTLDQATLHEELDSGFALLKDAAGVETTMIRPPYGEFTANTWLLSQGKVSVSVLWSMDSEDWKLPGANTIADNSTAGLLAGGIILMHDGGGNRDQDLEALPIIIERLKERGFEFVTISELLDADEDIPDEIAQGNATMPADAVWPTELASD